MEDQQAVTMLRQMLAAYGPEPKPERVAMYLETLGCRFSTSDLAQAIRDAMREAGDYPPGPGTLSRCLRAVRRERPGDPVETPREDGPRLGPGAQPLLLPESLERRVVGYGAVISRAAEIRDRMRLPASLDARLFSLGEAERELGWKEPAYSCRCPTRCGPHFEASLATERRAAEDRLRAVGVLR